MPNSRPDYKAAIEELKAAPDFGEAVSDAWFSGSPSHRTGCLFQFMSPNGRSHYDGREYGCLSMVKFQPRSYQAHTEEMQQKIIDDPRIPDDVGEITEETLEVFREYQEDADLTFRI